MNQRAELRQLDKLAALFTDIKQCAPTACVEPFWEAHLQATAESGLALIAQMRVELPATAPARKEPEAILLAPGRNKPVRTTKGN